MFQLKKCKMQMRGKKECHNQMLNIGFYNFFWQRFRAKTEPANFIGKSCRLIINLPSSPDFWAHSKSVV